MDIKKFLSSSYHILSPHHHYQMTVIFLFVFGFFLIFPFFRLVQIYNLDIQIWQWYFFLPWAVFYSFYCLYQRAKISRPEMRNPLKRPIIHWTLLGIAVILVHSQPVDINNIYALDLGFTIFTIFLADSYWDFKKINLLK